jgi:phage tail sheath protein FI
MPLPGLSFEIVRSAEPQLGLRADRVAIAALTERGPAETPVLVHSREQYADVFGCPVPGTLGSVAATSLFDNGAAEIVVSRVVPVRDADLAVPASAELVTAVGGVAFPLVLAEPGAFGNDVQGIPVLAVADAIAGASLPAPNRLTAPGAPQPEVGQVIRVFARGADHWARVDALSASDIVFSPALPSPPPAGSPAAAQLIAWEFELRIREPGRADVVARGLDLRHLAGLAAVLAGTPVAVGEGAVAIDDVPAPGQVIRFGDGADGIADVDLDAAENLDALADAFRRALRALDASSLPDIVIAPDLWSRIFRTKGVRRLALDAERATDLANDMVRSAALSRDRVVVVDAPLSGPDDLEPMTVEELETWRAARATDLGADRDFAAAYTPWIRVPSAVTFRGDDTLLVPPSIAVAGQMARTSRERAPWISTGNVALRGALGLSSELTLRERERLQDAGINPLAVRNPEGATIQGVRSLAWPDRKPWRFLSTRRLFNFLQRALPQIGRSYVFEPNAPATWISLRRDLTAMLEDMFRRGALAGSTPAQAFFVKVDAELNPPDVRDAGVLNAQIGVAPAAPLEFLVVRLVLEGGSASVVEGA